MQKTCAICVGYTALSDISFEPTAFNCRLKYQNVGNANPTFFSEPHISDRPVNKGPSI